MIDVSRFIGDRLYFDTNVLIYFVEGHARYRLLLNKMFEALDNNAFRAVTSELTLAEALVKPFAEAKQEVARVYMDLLSDGSHLTVAPVDRAILVRSAELRATLNCRAFDAIHLATAELARCDFFVTEDARIRVPETMTLLRLSDLLEAE
jgi:predicted nucleic acid-binding protein